MHRRRHIGRFVFAVRFQYNASWDVGTGRGAQDYVGWEIAATDTVDL
jgi:hypothetical protein